MTFDHIDDFIHHAHLLLVIGLDHLFDNSDRLTVFACCFGEGLGIFGETRSAVPWSWLEKRAANAAVQAHPFGDMMNVSPDSFAKVGDLVDEGDLCCQECIGGVFDQLRRGNIGKQDGGFDAIQGLIQIFEYLFGPV